MDPNVGAIIIDSIALISIFGWPVGLVYIITRHREKMRRLEYERTGSPGLASDVAALRQEVAQLRETTTRFDMSYDAALDRLERRLALIDGHGTNTAEVYPTYRTTEEPASVVASVRRS